MPQGATPLLGTDPPANATDVIYFLPLDDDNTGGGWPSGRRSGEVDDTFDPVNVLVVQQNSPGNANVTGSPNATPDPYSGIGDLPEFETEFANWIAGIDEGY